jgi:hypothetical protein
MYLQKENLKSMSAETKPKQGSKAKDIVNVLATVTKYIDEKAYHYHNKVREDMVEVHVDPL